MAKIIVLGAMKGGVGKSVSTYNLAYSLNKLGKKVLVADFDSSANIIRCVIEDIKTVEISIGDLMMNQMDEEEQEQPNPAEYIINRNGVEFIPSSKVLSAVDAKLRLEMGAEKILAYILESLREEYDYILIDISMICMRRAEMMIVSMHRLRHRKILTDFNFEKAP